MKTGVRNEETEVLQVPGAMTSMLNIRLTVGPNSV